MKKKLLIFWLENWHWITGLILMIGFIYVIYGWIALFAVVLLFGVIGILVLIVMLISYLIDNSNALAEKLREEDK